MVDKDSLIYRRKDLLIEFIEFLNNEGYLNDDDDSDEKIIEEFLDYLKRR